MQNLIQRLDPQRNKPQNGELDLKSDDLYWPCLTAHAGEFPAVSPAVMVSEPTPGTLPPVVSFQPITGSNRDALEALALASSNVQRALDGAEVKKVIVVPDRLVNLVI